jgi:hypothetical protein
MPPSGFSKLAEKVSVSGAYMLLRCPSNPAGTGIHVEAFLSDSASRSERPQSDQPPANPFDSLSARLLRWMSLLQERNPFPKEWRSFVPFRLSRASADWVWGPDRQDRLCKDDSLERRNAKLGNVI